MLTEIRNYEYSKFRTRRELNNSIWHVNLWPMAICNNWMGSFFLANIFVFLSHFDLFFSFEFFHYFYLFFFGIPKQFQAY